MWSPMSANSTSVQGIFQSSGVSKIKQEEINLYGFGILSVGQDAALECYITKSQSDETVEVETNSFVIIINNI